MTAFIPVDEGRGDPRRGLVIRPGPALPSLQLNEGSLGSDSARPFVNGEDDKESPKRTGLSLTIPPSPTFSEAASPPDAGQKRNRRPTIARAKRSPQVASEAPRGLVENRKLLAHLLDRLENRVSSPNLLQLASTKARDATTRHRKKETGSTRRIGKVVIAAAQSGIGVGQGPVDNHRLENGDEDDDGDGLGEDAAAAGLTEPIFDLVDQTRGLLVLAHRQGLKLFECSYALDHDPITPSKVETKGGRLSTFASPITSKRPNSPKHAPSSSLPHPVTISGDSLHRRLSDVTRSLFMDDCMYQIRLFRPTQPPNALQAACLDMAAYLYQAGDWASKLEMVDLVVEGLQTVPSTMLDKMIGWLEGAVTGLLDLMSSPPMPQRSHHTMIDASQKALYTSGDRQTDLRVDGLLAKLTRTLCDITASLQRESLTAKRIDLILVSICQKRPSASIDLLHTVAVGQAGARQNALDLLHRLWPGCLGHNRIAEPVELIAMSQEHLSEDAKRRGRPATSRHHYIPWRISSHDALIDLNKHCLVCEAEIHGFCVRCSHCNEQCHLHCLRSSTQAFTFEMIRLSESGTSTPRTVHTKFSEIATVRKGRVGLPKQSGLHDLRPVNLFTTTKCATCRQPIWGTMRNAYACMGGCQRLYHPHCIDRQSASPCRPGQHIVINELTGDTMNPFEIDIEDLERSFQSERQIVCLDEHAMVSKSFDEIAILYGSLWLQHKILESGLATGSIAIAEGSRKRNDGRSDLLGFRPVLRRYDNYLKANRDKASPASADFANSAGLEQPLAQGYLFCRRFLTYCTALLRSPPTVNIDEPANAFLNPFGPSVDTPEPSCSVSPEVVSAASLRSGLASDLAIRDPQVADVLLAQLTALGLCSETPSNGGTREEATSATGSMVFSLPLLMDATPSVELLILAIEVLLDDLDLSNNEQALILLCTRAWPSLLCSPYALERLGGTVISWIMSEDESLHVLIKQYASQNRPLPGVRSASTSEHGYGGTSSVPLYTNDRSRILAEYAVPWLRALYDMDPELYDLHCHQSASSADADVIRYVHILYERSKVFPGSGPAHAVEEQQTVALNIAATALDRLMSATEAKVVFGDSVEFCVAWLEDLGELIRKDRPFRLLPRLVIVGSSEGRLEDDGIWVAVKTTASTSAVGHAKACMWTRALSVSGVSVPWEVLQQLLTDNAAMSLFTIQDLIVAVTNNETQAEMDQYAVIACDLFDLLAVALIGRSSNHHVADDEEEALHRGLNLLLKAYGVMEQDVQATLLASPIGIESRYYASVSKRKRLTVAMGQVQPRKETLSSVASLLAIPRLPIAKLVDFVWLFTSKASLVSNIDGFMFGMALELFETFWTLLPLSDIRPQVMKILLRLLSFDSSPLKQYVEEQMVVNPTATRDRLLEFVLGLMDHQAHAAHGNASSGVIGLIFIFFEDALDPRANVPDTSIVLDSLLPTQLSAIAQYFSDYLIRSDDETRIFVLGKLARFQNAMTHWSVLPWSTIEELLAEQVAAVTQMTSWRGSQVGSVLTETQMVRAGLIAVGLAILASGNEIAWTTAQRFQQHVASACALPWSIPNEGVVNLILPALRSVLDSSHHLSPGGQNRKSVLVGALFVPVIIDFGNELKRHDSTTQRCLLDILHVAIYKQELRTVELAVLGALQTVADHAAAPGSTENRLLAFRVLQTALLRIAPHSMLRVSPPVFTSIAKAHVEEMDDNGDPAIVEQSRGLLRSMINTFGRSGMFVQVFKVESINSRWNRERSLVHRAINLLVGGDGGPAILDALLEDTADVLKKDPDGLSDMLGSLQSFAAINEMELTEDAAESLGSLITRVTKHVADWEAAAFDPNPLIVICRHFLNHIPPASVPPLVHQMSTFLLVALSRFDVHEETLGALLQVSTVVTTRCAVENTVEMVVYEEAAKKGLYDPQMTPRSMTSVIKIIQASHTRDPGNRSASKAIVASSSACMAILSRQHSLLANIIEADVLLSLLAAAARLLIAAEELDEGSLARHLDGAIELPAQARCDLFAQLLLAKPTASTLSRLCPVIARATSLCLRAAGDLLSVADTGGEGTDMLASMFNVIRTVILATDEQSGENFWDRTWPDWHRLLTISTEKTSVNAPLRTVCHSVFFEIVTFLDSVESHLLVSRQENMDDITTMIDRWSRANSVPRGAKLVKAKEALRGAGQQRGQGDPKAIRLKVEADILAGEKLRSLRGRR